MTGWEIAFLLCPTGAITFEEREAPEYDEEAVKEAQKEEGTARKDEAYA